MSYDFCILLKSLNKVEVDFIIQIVSTGLITLIFIIILHCVKKHKKHLHEEEVKFYNRESEKMMNHAVELERQRISRNLHDNVNTLLNVVKLNLTKTSLNANNKILSKELIEDSKGLIDNAIEHIRGISKELLPPTLAKLGYEKAIEEMCNSVNTGGINKINFNGCLNGIQLSKRVELQLYRITQEIINNIFRHGMTREVDILIKADVIGISVIISYLGWGITSEMVEELAESDRGCGLKNIQCRASMINASVNYASEADNEYKTTIHIPTYENKN